LYEEDTYQLVFRALLKWHGYQGDGMVHIYQPASHKQLVALGKDRHGRITFSTSTVSRFLKSKFPDAGANGYKEACINRTIGVYLASWHRY